MSRIWNIRLNTDLLAHELGALEGDAEQAAWLRGFAAGSTGRPVRAGATAPWMAGHAFGSAAHGEAMAKSAKQADLAHRRWSEGKPPHARAMPTHMPDRCQEHAGDMPTHMPTHMPTACQGPCQSDATGMPIEESKNRRIEESIIETTTNDVFTREASSSPPPRIPNLGDLQAVCPALLVRHDDRTHAAQILSLYGWDACVAGCRELAAKVASMPAGKRRVFPDALADWLSQRFELLVEDYARAGIDAPPNTATGA